MEAQFWLEKWQKNEIGFHLQQAHPWLVANWQHFQTADVKRVFVPLCGKSLDLDFLLAQNLAVLANELSEQAIIEVFERLQLIPEISSWQGGKIYHKHKLTVFVGDFFQLSNEHMVNVDLIYDRAALIALPESMREQYTQTLIRLCPNAAQCLITLDYDQALMSGPPFALSDKEVIRHYQDAYTLEVIKQADIIEHEPRFKQNGLPQLWQRVYRLMPKHTA